MTFIKSWSMFSFASSFHFDVMGLDANRFMRYSQMKNLTVLKLNSSKLQEIQSGTFDQLKLLESLDLSSNNLKTLTASVITGLRKLRFFNLAGNRLKVISSKLLDPLKVLKSVDQSNNECINMSYPKVASNEIKDQIIKECLLLIC